MATSVGADSASIENAAPTSGDPTSIDRAVRDAVRGVLGDRGSESSVPDAPEGIAVVTGRRVMGIVGIPLAAGGSTESILEGSDDSNLRDRDRELRLLPGGRFSWGVLKGGSG